MMHSHGTPGRLVKVTPGSSGTMIQRKYHLNIASAGILVLRKDCMVLLQMMTSKLELGKQICSPVEHFKFEILSVRLL